MKNKQYKIAIVFSILLLFVIGYAALNSTLSINGIANINSLSFSVHFDNITIANESVYVNESLLETNATINPLDNKQISYTISLTEPGDFYEFTVDIVNDGTIDAAIEEIVSKMNNVVINNNLPKYLEYNVTYVDNSPIIANHTLEAGHREKCKVKITYSTNLNPNELPDTAQTLNFSMSIKYVQATGEENATNPVGPVANVLEPGEIVNYANVDFYVVSTDATTTKLLKKEGIENSTNFAFTTAYNYFDTEVPAEEKTYPYWYSASGFTSNYPGQGYEYREVYDTNTLFYNNVELFEQTLKNAGYTSASARLMTNTEAQAFEQIDSEALYNQTFWLGTARYGSIMIAEKDPNNNPTNNRLNAVYAASSAGRVVRPLVEVSTSELLGN